MGWKPYIDLRHGIDATYAWFLAQSDNQTAQVRP
ncbi:MAG: hypothetical protein JWM36_2258, partial [Hyphomicrobiales bacterium]|nr:hypothetical protein [Hyphomicrobiales bacterium]